MKTKIIAAFLIASAFTTPAFSQNSLQAVASSATAVPVTETYFGAGFNYPGTGAVITEITPYSPAETFNFKKGDVVTMIDNYTINSASDLETAMQSLKPGTVATVAYTRKGKAKTKKVTLDQIKVFK